MINTNSIWAYRGAAAEIDIRSHFKTSKAYDEGRELTGKVLLRTNSNWNRQDRLAEVSGRRFAHAEQIMQSVADCLVESLLVEATAQGVPIKSVNATVEAACEPMARPGVLSRLRSGPRKLELSLLVVSDASEEVIGRLVVAARRSSPAFDMVATGVAVEVSRIDA